MDPEPACHRVRLGGVRETEVPVAFSAVRIRLATIGTAGKTGDMRVNAGGVDAMSLPQ